MHLIEKILVLVVSLAAFRSCEKSSGESLECSLIKQSFLSNSAQGEDSLEFAFIAKTNFAFTKCGIVSASLVNNRHSNPKFIMKWAFRNTRSIELDFRLEPIEDLSYLSYYYSIRRFDGQDFYSSVKALQSSLGNSSHDIKNTLLLNMEIISNEYIHEFDLLKNAFVVCVIVVNLKLGISFNLPFMCADVFFDKFFYQNDKVESVADIILVPLAVLAFVVIAVFYKSKPKEDAKREISFSSVEGSLSHDYFRHSLQDTLNRGSLHRRSLSTLESSSFGNQENDLNTFIRRISDSGLRQKKLMAPNEDLFGSHFDVDEFIMGSSIPEESLASPVDEIREEKFSDLVADHAILASNSSPAVENLIKEVYV